MCYAVRNIKAKAIFKQWGPSCKKKISTLNTPQRIYENFD